MNSLNEIICKEYDEMMAFRKRMMKLSKKELIDRMLNMKAFIDDLVEGSE
tara:strand:- start:1075 stop:1224 length:150 start_codon:yes stop_codon:yes gene_type:complete